MFFVFVCNFLIFCVKHFRLLCNQNSKDGFSSYHFTLSTRAGRFDQPFQLPMRARVRDATSSDTNTIETYTENGFLPPYRWTHVTLVVDTKQSSWSNNIKLYIDTHHFPQTAFSKVEQLSLSSVGFSLGSCDVTSGNDRGLTGCKY